MAGDQVDRLIDILESDAKKYDDLADNLEAFMEHLRGAQLEWAKAETERRRARAAGRGVRRPGAALFNSTAVADATAFEHLH